MMGMGFLGLRIGMNAFEQRHKIKKKQIQTKAIEQQTMNGSTKINKALG